MEKEFTTGMSAYLSDVVDDWCGTKPHGPFPHHLGDVVFAAAIYDLAGRVSDTAIRGEIQNLSLKLGGSALQAAQSNFTATASKARNN